MPNFNDFKLRIAQELGSDRNSDLTVEIDNAVHDAIEFYSGERFYFLETDAILSTIAGVSEYGVSLGLPNDIQEIDEISAEVHNANYILSRKPMDWWVDIQSNPTQGIGEPTDFAFYEQALWLYPTPSEVFRLRIYYLRRREVLDSPDDTNPWLTGLPGMLVRAHAKWIIFENTIQSDEEAQRMQQEAAIYLSQLRQRSSQMITTGTNRPYQW